MLDSGPTAAEAATIDRHAAYLNDLVERGVALVAGRTLTTGRNAQGIVIIRAGSDADARAVMETDPAVADRVMIAEIFPYRVAFVTGEPSTWLPGGDRPDPVRAHLDKLLCGEGAHDRIENIVRGFPARLAGEKTPGSRATAWRLMEHLRIAQWDILEFSRNTAHISPEFPDGYWPAEDAPPDDESWTRCGELFLTDLDQMRRFVGDPANNLYLPLPQGTGQTLLREALLVADHNAYHLGQLMQLRHILENRK